MIPFQNAVVIDYEFRADPGERPHVWCLCALDVRSRTVRRWWRDELLAMSSAPFDTSADTVICSYAMSAEMSCFLQLGWKPPEYLLDLYAEYRWLTNGRELRFPDRSALKKHKNSMLAAAFILGVPAMEGAEKARMRELAMTRWEFTDQERVDMMDYCAEDTRITEGIFWRLVEYIDWPRALLRGRYGFAVAAMEHCGIPIDAGRWSHFLAQWPDISLQLIAEVDAGYGVYREGHFSDQLFHDYLVRNGIDWPMTPTGRPMRDKETMRDMARLHPQLNSLKELLATFGQGRLLRLAIGRDGYNRTGLIPFCAVTGRNQPSSAAFVFGPATWLRSFILAKEGEAVAYLDWSAEEIALAAALSGDQALIDDYRTGDPYMAFAVRAGLAPPGATKQTHEALRDRCKVLFLSLNYGRTARGLASALGVSIFDAEALMYRHEQAYPALYRWLRGVVDGASLTRWQHSVFGWRRYITSPLNARSVRNWPCQSAGAELMQLTAMALIDAGVQVCAPVHDAYLIKAPLHAIGDKVKIATGLMETISEVVTGGLRIRADAKTYPYPKRFSDRRGEAMWNRVMGLLQFGGTTPQPTVIDHPSSNKH